MPRGVASSKQLAMMSKVLDAYCATAGITDGDLRDDLATFLLGAFDRGVRTEAELVQMLTEHVGVIRPISGGPSENR